MSLGVLRIKVITWDKPNYELFDGESDVYKTNNFEVSSAGVIYRNNQENEAYMAQELKLMEPSLYKILLQIQVHNGNYTISSGRRMNFDDLWYQLQGRPQTMSQLGFADLQEYVQIKQNDIIKLGKKQFKVLSINNQLTETSHYETFGSLLEGHYDSIAFDPIDVDRKQCRICLSCSYNPQNPLISPCKCMGSTKYIHYECLKRWLDGKMQMRQCPPYAIEINSKSVRCEICLAFYPPSITLGGTQFQLYDLVLGEHVIFEDFDGLILILNFAIETLTLGRGHESSVKISEITISRTHVKLQLNDKKLFIQDQSSKFGTLLKVQQNREIQNNETLYLQSGRSRIVIKHIVDSKSWLHNLCPY